MNCMVDGSPDAAVLVVAMAPGRDELREDRPLVGASGRLVWNQLKKAGIDRTDCYILNTIREWPAGKNGGPTAEQFETYWPAFEDAIARSKAHVALLLGGDALWRVTGLRGVEDWRGYLIARDECRWLDRRMTYVTTYKTSTKNHRKGDERWTKRTVQQAPPYPASVRWAIPTYHPAAVMRTGFGVLPAFSADIQRVGRALRGQLRLEVLPAADPAVFDIETGGEKYDVLERCGATMRGSPWSLPWGPEAKELLKAELARTSPAVAYNIAFDAPRLEDAGVPIPEPWFCEMLAAATLKPDMKKSLNYVASLYLDTQRWKHLAASDPETYNLYDVIKEQALYEPLVAELHRTGMYELFTKRMMPTLPTLVRMTRCGIRVDQSSRAAWLDKLAAREREVVAKWEGLAPGVKTAGSGLAAFLRERCGLDGTSTEVSALRALILRGKPPDQAREIINPLLELRGIRKDISTYAEVEVAEDGCVHPGYLPAGKDDDAFGRGTAGTGRLASSNPNIQNQTAEARLMFRPHRDDQVLLEFDYSQIEARILARLAGDGELETAIAEGLHESNMRVLGVDKTRAKNGFYGWSYGAGARTLYNTFIGKGFLVPIRECEELLRGFDKRFARTAAWRNAVGAEAATRFYLTNPFGRRRYFMAGAGDVTKGFNYHPQSSAADIMWTILRQLEDGLRGLDASLLATVHDSVLLESERSQAPRVVEVVRSVMEQPWPELGGLVVPVAVKMGERWGSMDATPLRRP